MIDKLKTRRHFLNILKLGQREITLFKKRMVKCYNLARGPKLRNEMRGCYDMVEHKEANNKILIDQVQNEIEVYEKVNNIKGVENNREV